MYKDTFIFKLAKLLSRFIQAFSSAYMNYEYDIWNKFLPIIAINIALIIVIKNKISIPYSFKFSIPFNLHLLDPYENLMEQIRELWSAKI